MMYLLVSPMSMPSVSSSPMDAGSAPKRILAAQPLDQTADFLRDYWPTRLPAPNLRGPEQPEALAVPIDDGLRLDDHQRRSPAGPETGKPCPEEAISSRQFRSLHRTLENAELVTQREVLQWSAARDLKAAEAVPTSTRSTLKAR
jgi:hypothetical protein